VQREFKTGERQTLKYQDNADIKQGDLFILDGQKVIVVEMGKPFVSNYDRPDRILSVAYDNATERLLAVIAPRSSQNHQFASNRWTAAVC
jgi:hypothetical protein